MVGQRSLLLYLFIIIDTQNKYWHELHGIVRQGAPLYLVCTNAACHSKVQPALKSSQTNSNVVEN
jgi:hypothetical protein